MAEVLGGTRRQDESGAMTYSGAGAKGTSYSGGSGGGAVGSDIGGTHYGNNGKDNGAAGGDGWVAKGAARWLHQYAGGGAGNPGGIGRYYLRNGSPQNSLDGKGEDGTGGLLIIKADSILNNSIIESKGCKGGLIPDLVGSEYLPATGGSSGGGSINIFYLKTFTKSENSIITADGGSMKNDYGSYGGNGSITIGNISSGTFVKDE